METILKLRDDVDYLMQVFRKVVEGQSVISWSPSDGPLHLLKIAVLRRQFDCLEAIVDLASRSLGFASAPLLRPAVEELIWVKYLNRIPESQARRLVGCILQEEVRQALERQKDLIGATDMMKMGLFAHLQDYSSQRLQVHGELHQLADELKWPKRKNDRPPSIPSMEYLAKQTDTLFLYKSVYHATSRFVHFSTMELIRRAWGKPGEMRIDSNSNEMYWRSFSLSWGIKLFKESLLEVQDSLNRNENALRGIDEQRFELALSRIEEAGLTPFITADDLNWPW